MEKYFEIIKEKIKYLIIRAFAGMIVGSLCGVLGWAFHIFVDKGSKLRLEHSFILYFMPVVGLFIVFMYKLFKTNGLDTSTVLERGMKNDPVTILLLPAVFIGTVLTHFVGGSSGREGAAIQMGGSIGSFIGRVLHLDKLHQRVAVLSGMAAFFTALFGTPIAATLFVMMVTFVGITVYEIYFPVFVSSITAFFVSKKLGVRPTRFDIKVPNATIKMLILVCILAFVCAIVAILFYKLLHYIEGLFEKINNPYIRVIVGSVIFIIAILIIGNMRYCGAGMDVIRNAIEKGEALPFDFILKIVLTAVTLGCGFKGGEVVPTFFVGASFGAIFAPLIGINAGFGAALGLVSVFCAATNTLIPSIFLALELFSGKGLIFFATSCTVSYFVSGRDGLYSCQKMLDEKDMFKLFHME